MNVGIEQVLSIAATAVCPALLTGCAIETHEVIRAGSDDPDISVTRITSASPPEMLLIGFEHPATGHWAVSIPPGMEEWSILRVHEDGSIEEVETRRVMRRSVIDHVE